MFFLLQNASSGRVSSTASRRDGCHCARMGQDNITRRMLHDIVGRADHVGHVILEGEELAFATSREGAKWLEPIDPGRHLYKVLDAARQQLAP